MNHPNQPTPRCIRNHCTSVDYNDKHHNAAVRVIEQLLARGGR